MLQVRRLALSGVVALALLAVSSRARADAESCLRAAESSQRLRADGKLGKAREVLIECSAATCPAAVRADCTRWLDEVAQAAPSIVVRAVDEAGKDVVEARVRVDGGPAGDVKGLPMSLDPGKHRVAVSAPGRVDAAEDVVLAQGEKERLVEIVLRSPGGPAPPGEGRTLLSPLPIALFAVGAVSAGVGAAFWVSGSGAHADLESGCARTSSCAHDDVVSARTRLIVGDVLVGVAVASITAGVIIGLTGGKRAADTRARVGDFVLRF